MKLNGQKIMLGRPASEVIALEAALCQEGADVCCVALIEICPVAFDAEKIQTTNFDIAVITSQHGVPAYMELRSRMEPHKVAAVGDKTAEALSRAGIAVDFVGSGEGAAALGKRLHEQVGLADKSIFYPCSILAKKSFKSDVEKLGARVEMVPVYTSKPPVHLPDAPLLGYHTAVFFSGSGAENYFSLVPVKEVKNMTAVALGKSTRDVLEKIGVPQIVTSERPNTESLFNAILHSQSQYQPNYGATQ